MRVLEIPVDKVVDILAVVHQQQLTDQLVVGRYRTVLGLFAAECPVHLLDEVDHREGTIDLRQALGPLLEIADLDQPVVIDQAVTPLGVEDDLERHGAEEILVDIVGCLADLVIR